MINFQALKLFFQDQLVVWLVILSPQSSTKEITEVFKSKKTISQSLVLIWEEHLQMSHVTMTIMNTYLRLRYLESVYRLPN